MPRYVKKFGKPLTSIDAASLENLRQYHWAGNVRELQNVIERAVILSQSEILKIEPLLTSPMSNPQTNQLKTLEAVEREHILQMLETTAWVISGFKSSAAILGMNPNTLRSRMLKLGIP